MDRLEQRLHLALATSRPTLEVTSTVRSCVEELQKMISLLDGDWHIRVFGSFSNGMCSNSSDLDVTCYRKAPALDKDLREKMEFLSLLRTQVGSHPEFAVVELVSSARVPVLKLRYRNFVDVDLSYNNTEPFKNTQLIRAYTELSPLIRDFLHLVKIWSKAAGIVGAKDGNLSSYSMTLLGIYFCQVSDIALPCFPTSCFDGGVVLPQNVKVAWSCPIPLAHMLCNFFTFYANEFKWGEEVVTVHLGRRTYSQDPIHAHVHDIWGERLHVVDPFLTHRNLNCVLKYENEAYLFEEINTAAEWMRHGYAPTGFSSLNSVHMYAPPYAFENEGVYAASGVLPHSHGEMGAPDGGGDRGNMPRKPIGQLPVKGKGHNAMTLSALNGGGGHGNIAKKLVAQIPAKANAHSEMAHVQSRTGMSHVTTPNEVPRAPPAIDVPMPRLALFHSA